MDDTISMITITVLAASALYLLFLVASRDANYRAVTIELTKKREVVKELAAHNSYQEAQVKYLRKVLDSYMEEVMNEVFDSEEKGKDS